MPLSRFGSLLMIGVTLASPALGQTAATAEKITNEMRAVVFPGTGTSSASR
jgi:hypothetical protein